MSNKSLVRDFERKRKRTSWYDIETVGGHGGDDPHALAADQRFAKFDESAPRRGVFNGVKTPAQKRRDILFAASDKRGLFCTEVGDSGRYQVAEKRHGTQKVHLTNVCYNDALAFIDSQPIQSPGR